MKDFVLMTIPAAWGAGKAERSHHQSGVGGGNHENTPHVSLLGDQGRHYNYMYVLFGVLAIQLVAQRSLQALVSFFGNPY